MTDRSEETGSSLLYGRVEAIPIGLWVCNQALDYQFSSDHIAHQLAMRWIKVARVLKYFAEDEFIQPLTGSEYPTPWRQQLYQRLDDPRWPLIRQLAEDTIIRTNAAAVQAQHRAIPLDS